MTIKKQEFFEFSKKIDNYLADIMLNFGLNATNYHFNYILETIVQNQLVIRSFPFKNLSKQTIIGLLINDHREVTLAYNPELSNQQKMFTLAHEFTHYLYHLTSQATGFVDTKDLLTSGMPTDTVEFQANWGASCLLLPEEVLITELKSGTATRLISEKYGLSEEQLFTRLCLYMQANLRTSTLTATHIAQKIMANSSKRTAIELGQQLEAKRLQQKSSLQYLPI